MSNEYCVAGSEVSVVDLALYSVIRQLSLEKELQPELARWFSKAEISLGFKNKNRERKASERKSKSKSPVKEVKKDAKKEKQTNKKTAGKNKFGKTELFGFFDENGIVYENIDHPEVFTVEAMMPYLTNVKGAVCKNLFLKDKKKNLYLLSAVHDKEIKLNDVAKTIGAKELRFADESVMLEKLGVTQGCVTAYALINDADKSVKFIVDKNIVNGSYPSVNFHPLVNTATTAVSCGDFNKFLTLTGHHVIEI